MQPSGHVGCSWRPPGTCVQRTQPGPPRSPCSHASCNSATGVSARQQWAACAGRRCKAQKCRSSALRQPVPAWPCRRRVSASRDSAGCSANRSGWQSGEWFANDPLPSEDASISEALPDSVVFLTGRPQFDDLFCEIDNDAAATLDRRWQSLNGSPLTSRISTNSVSNCSKSGQHIRGVGQGPDSNSETVEQPTELILQLEKYGSGWGEEIFPRASLVQRPIQTKQRLRNRSTRPDPWEEGSAERYLADVCGVPESQVDSVMSAAVAWRVTAGGRPLIDRRRRSRVERNIRIVERYLIDKCGLPPGKDGVGRVFQLAPAIMRCKPTINDRWDRRVVELAAYLYRNGHCNVPEECDEMPELGAWVKRQRVARQQAGLTQERLDILTELGFEFGEEAQLTEEWEWRFDSLVELLLMREMKVSTGELEPRSLHDWVGMDWGTFGGPAAREVALWVQLQREFRRRNLLSAPAVRRLNAIGFEWEPTGGLEWQHRWMACFAQLVYLIERSKKVVQARSAQQEQEKRRQLAQQPSLPPSGQPGQHGGQPAAAHAGRPPMATDLFEGLSSWRRTAGLAPAGVAAQRWLQQEVERRRTAFAVTKLEPGLRAWLVRQQRDWRQGRLTHEQTLLLTLCGVDLELYAPAQWRAAAHEAASYLTGSNVRPMLEGLNNGSKESKGEQKDSSAEQPSRWSSLSLTVGARSTTAFQLQQIPRERHRILEAEDDGPAAAERSAAAATSVLQRSAGEAGAEGPGEEVGPWWQDFLQAGGLPLHARVRAMVRGREPPGRPPGRRLAVVRWLETQRQLWAEQRLSQTQLRYMALLGITWILSDEVVLMGKAVWSERLQQLATLRQRVGEARVDARSHSETLHDWLEHQKALLAIDWLSLERERQLMALGVDWRPDRGAAERMWDARLTQLLAFHRQHGHLQVLPGWEHAPDLAQWLHAVRAQWRDGQLLSSQIGQLAALKITPLDIMEH